MHFLSEQNQSRSKRRHLREFLPVPASKSPRCTTSSFSRAAADEEFTVCRVEPLLFSLNFGYFCSLLAELLAEPHLLGLYIKHESEHEKESEQDRES